MNTWIGASMLLAPARCAGWSLAWAMAPPVVPMPLLIGALVGCCSVLFVTRSTREIKQHMLDRIYGPGARQPRCEWWETDLDPLLARKLGHWRECLRAFTREKAETPCRDARAEPDS